MDFDAPKRFTIGPGLTITKVRIWRPKPSKMPKNQKSFFLIRLSDFGFSSPLEAQMT